MNKIIRLCSLPPSNTQRCLILRAFENMMKNKLKDRTFSFLDRNYVEEYKDQNIMRQVLSRALSEQRPDVLTEYFELEDGLLVSIFFKNPQGRLLRR